MLRLAENDIDTFGVKNNTNMLLLFQEKEEEEAVKGAPGTSQTQKPGIPEKSCGGEPQEPEDPEEKPEEQADVCLFLFIEK